MRPNSLFATSSRRSRAQQINEERAAAEEAENIEDEFEDVVEDTTEDAE